MRIGLFCLLALICSVSAGAESLPLFALPPDAGVRACLSDTVADKARCEAFFRGGVERRQIWLLSPIASCRYRPLDQSDIDAFAAFLRQRSDNDDRLVSYLISLKEPLPCESTSGIWTNAQLSELCHFDHSFDSPCHYYFSSLLRAAGIESRLRNIRIFCPEGFVAPPENRLRSKPLDELLGYYDKWLAINSWKRLDSAASGFIEAMAMGYPCTDSERRYPDLEENNFPQPVRPQPQAK